jgi:hypothetical protein
MRVGVCVSVSVAAAMTNQKKLGRKAALCGSRVQAASAEAANLESAPKSGRFIATVVIERIGKLD